MAEDRQPLMKDDNAQSYGGTSYQQNQNVAQTSESSTSDLTVKLKIDLKNIVFPVGKITVNSQYAKKLIFFLTKPNGEATSEDESIADSSIDKIVAKDFSGYKASSVQVHFIPSDKTKRVSIKYFEIKEHIANAENDTMTSFQTPSSSTQQGSTPCVPTTSTDTSDRTIDNLGPELNVKVVEEDKEVEFPVRKITVTSKNANETIVCTLKPNDEELTKKMVTNPLNEIPVEADFLGETVSSVKIRFILYDNSTNTSVKRIKMEMDKVDKIDGSTQLVVFGVVILAIVVSIMAIHWANLIYEDDCSSEKMVLWLLIVVSALGIISVLILIIFRFWNGDNSIHTSGITFLKIKLVFMYIFGLGYLSHCGLYAWKHTFENKCLRNNDLGLEYNVLSIFYTFFLFVYFALFYERKYDNTFCENFASLFVMVTNACIWLDAIFSESGKVFIDNNSTEWIAIINSSSSSNRATEAIKMTDSFLSPAMIEFSLISIDLLFTQTYGLSPEKHQQSDEKKKLRIEKKSWQVPVERFFQIVFSLIAFALFAFTLVVVLTNDESSDAPDYPDDFKFYVYYQFGMKCLMFILITICFFVEFSCFTFHFNVSTFVLLVACFGNVVYHILYCFALDSNKNKPRNCPLIFSLIENSIGILLALFQSVFIIGTHMPKDYAKFSDESRVQKCKYWLHKNVVHYACCLLGILNLGLWVSDSIGELRLPVFSITIYNAFGIKGWSVINKIILPLTIFFRFHTAFDFLEYYWKHDTMIGNGQKNVQLSNKDQNGCCTA